MSANKRAAIVALKREITGRKVKSLRRQGLIPANLYGKTIKSRSLSVTALDFDKLFRKTGETNLIDLTITGDKSIHPVLISDIQYHPVSDRISHVDFREVNLAEKIIANIPIKIIGESLAIKDKGAVLVTVINEIEVEALPADLPDHIQVDISSLNEFGAAIHAKNLQQSSKVAFKIDPEEVIVTVQEPKEEKEETPVVTTPVEGEIPTEGEIPVVGEEKKPAEGNKSPESKSVESKSKPKPESNK